jgi:hypothetical protein
VPQREFRHLVVVLVIVTGLLSAWGGARSMLGA